MTHAPEKLFPKAMTPHRARALAEAREAGHPDPFDASWRERVAVLVPVYATIVAALVLGMIMTPIATGKLLALIPMTFFAVGKFLPLWGISGQSDFGPYELGALIWLLDTFTVVNMVYALEGFYRFAPVKRSLDRIQANARLVLIAFPRIRRAAVGGVILFVCFPVAGTGAIGATFLGILLGIHRRTLIMAVSFGGLLGGMAMAYAAVHFEGAVRALEGIKEDPVLRYVSIAGVILAIAAIVWWANRSYHRAIGRAATQDPVATSPDRS
jgi:uncharacterized membrane protein